jgi:hypothetical protein
VKRGGLHGFVAAAVLAAAGLPAVAAPLAPASDDTVVETLPAGGARGEDRALRRALAARPDDAALAVRVASRGLAQARATGDARSAGQALAALARWSDAATAPLDVLRLQATLRQHLHDFEPAAELLEALLRRAPGDAQARLTLATVRRVQGRLDASDAACAALPREGDAAVYALACAAENDGLRGRFDAARTALHGLLARPVLDAGTRGWLWTTVAELEQRAADPAAADAAWRSALQADPADVYTRLGRADFLLDQGRAAEVPALLAGLARSDAVLLRLAIAGVRSSRSDAAADELRARFAQSNLRPGVLAVHGREQALFAWAVDRDAARALAIARGNAAAQREAIDLWLFDVTARAAGDAAAQREAAALRRAVGLVDRRIAGEAA